MRRIVFSVLALAAFLHAAEEEFVFRSDVSLIRIDAQVVDRNNNRAITGLEREDFVLLEEGREQEVRNFATEDVPVDVLFLLDVSGSMRVHVERLASAASRALGVLAPGDRVAIMVFDRETRLRMPFRSNRAQIEQGLQEMLNSETFSGGTDITRALYDASQWVSRQGRPEARRAIVILTDDRTERGRDENGVGRSLATGNIVLSALLAPDAVGAGPVGVGFPGGTLGGIIFGRRGPLGSPIPMPRGGSLGSAGTANIARASGGDSFRVDEATALESTLSRIRQRYALHFNLPEGVRPGQERNIDVQLTAAARRRYPGADVRFRRAYYAPGTVTPTAPGAADETPVVVSENPPLRRRPGVSEPAGSAERVGGWRREGDPAPAGAAPPVAQGPAVTAPAAKEEPRRGGWRRVKPGEEP